ncbi:CPBP family intramembrane glutamic endopeptidase [Planctomicrobium sp. SH661]|uniref:CPBP family intramembrane glutamic endopeptidase n=1 Tax=Planctomicrobium sp. SH661 TaxID=3448124 RepID=UPI003F5BE575
MKNATSIDILFSLLTIVLVAGSVGFWIGAVRRLGRGEPVVPLRFRWRPVRVPRFPLAVTLFLLLVTGLGVALTANDAAQPTLEAIRYAVMGSIVEGVVVLFVLLTSLFLGARSRTDLVRLGFRSDNIPGQIHDGEMGLLATVIPTGLILILTASLRSVETEHPFLRLLKETNDGLGLFLILLSAVVFAPLKEELMFRVILQSWLEERFRPWLAVVLSSGAFAAVHGVPDSIALLPLALVLGYLFQRRRSYLAVVAVHALFNAYNLMATMVTVDKA